MTQTAFGSKLTERGFDKRHDNKGTLRCGIALRDDSSEEANCDGLFNADAPEHPVAEETFEYDF